MKTVGLRDVTPIEEKKLEKNTEDQGMEKNMETNILEVRIRGFCAEFTGVSRSLLMHRNLCC